jgi:hypothetical protein
VDIPLTAYYDEANPEATAGHDLWHVRTGVNYHQLDYGPVSASSYSPGGMTLLRVGNPAGGGILITGLNPTRPVLFRGASRVPVYEAGETLAGAIAWLGVAANVQAGTPYFIALTGDETLNSTWTLNNADLNLTLEGAGETRTINTAGVPAGDNLVISLSAGTLTLGNNLTLDGGGRAGRFIAIESGSATLNLTGATLTGNNNGISPGGAVYLASGTFTMSGGAITGNSSTVGGGGGVFIGSGSFTMTGGVISGNSFTGGQGGGGVWIGSGTFTMTGGAISGNSSTGGSAGGGGVLVGSNYPFTMTGGVISDNMAERGGGVCISSGSYTIHVDGGEIRDNTATNGDTFGKQVFQTSASHYIDVPIDPSMTVDNWAPGAPYWGG